MSDDLLLSLLWFLPLVGAGIVLLIPKGARGVVKGLSLGITLAMEHVGWYKPAHLARLVRAIDHPAIRIYFDMGNCLYVGENPLEQALGRECYARKVVLSLQKSWYIDSAGVGWLVMCHKRFRDAGGCLVLHSIPPMVNHVFHLLGLTDVLNMADDEAGAVARILQLESEPSARAAVAIGTTTKKR